MNLQEIEQRIIANKSSKIQLESLNAALSNESDRLYYILSRFSEDYEYNLEDISTDENVAKLKEFHDTYSEDYAKVKRLLRLCEYYSANQK